MYGKGSFSLYSTAMYYSAMIVALSTAERKPGNSSASLCYCDSKETGEHQTVSTSETRMLTPKPRNDSIRLIFSRPCRAQGAAVRPMSSFCSRLSLLQGYWEQIRCLSSRWPPDDCHQEHS